MGGSGRHGPLSSSHASYTYVQKVRWSHTISERELREFLPRAKASPDNDTPEISLPADGKRYNAEEEQSNISKLPKRTAVRGQAIKSMIEKGYVSSRTATYNHVRKYEHQHSKFLWPMEHRYYNEMAKSFVAKEMLGLGYKGWFMQPNVMTSAKWKGSIVMKLSPIRFHDNMPCSSRNIQIDICSIIGNSDIVELLQEKNIPKQNSSGREMYDYNGRSIPQQKNSMPAFGHSPSFDKILFDSSGKIVPQHKNIMSLPGPSPSFNKLFQEYHIPPLSYTTINDKDTDGITTKRISKLYFSPTEYPPPRDNAKHHNDITFGNLKNYIEHQAALGNSPVICTGGDKRKREKRFKCAFWNSRK